MVVERLILKMSIPIHFEDNNLQSISIASSWKSKSSKKSVECQTPTELYEFDDNQTQYGRSTRIIGELVSKKDRNMSLVDYFSEYHDQTPKNEWLNRIKSGSVSVDCEINTQPDLRVDAGQYLEYVDCKHNAEVIQ